jgi:phosphoribosylglycinamide formyltransferase-1
MINIHIAIFASGAGTNAQNIINYFKKNTAVKVMLIVGNKPSAGIVKVAAGENIPFLLLERHRFYTDGYVGEFEKYSIDLIVLAGFLWKIPSVLIQKYPFRIINIHPALLPLYGGKGMYGSLVHSAVIAAGEKESGITIHYVDEIYDHGAIIFQARCEVEVGDTPETLARKIHQLEYRHYPEVIERLIAPGYLQNAR